MPDYPTNGLGTASHPQLAISGADVRLHGIDAEKGRIRDLLVAEAPGDQAQYLGLASGEPLLDPQPVPRSGQVTPSWVTAAHSLALAHGLQCFDQFQAGQAWVQFCLIGENTFISESRWVAVR